MCSLLNLERINPLCNHYFEALKFFEEIEFKLRADRGAELKGDILLAQGKIDEARAAYQAAVDLSADQGINNPYLKIKLDDLAVAE